MLKTRKISSAFELPVYTDEGVFFGSVEEAIISENKVSGWRIRSVKNSKLRKILGGAKGVIVPHQYVKAMDNIMIISKAAVPSIDEGEPE
jgi:sporulation protein YlmC with PRC-barrel domain